MSLLDALPRGLAILTAASFLALASCSRNEPPTGTPTAATTYEAASATTPVIAAPPPSTTTPPAASPQGFDFVPEVAEVVATVLDRDGTRVGVVLKLHQEDAGGCDQIWGRSMSFRIPLWKAGGRIELDTLVPAPPGHWSTSETWVMNMDRSLGPANTPDSRRDRTISWRPTGRVEVLEAPLAVGESGRIAVDLRNGDFHFARTLPVRICLPLE